MQRMGNPVHRSNAWVHGLAAVTLALGASACATTQQSASIQRVDHLVTRIEAVHLEAELAKKSVYETILTLRPVIVPTEGDPATMFQGFMGALAASEERAEELQAAIAPMERSARDVFAQWERDLRAFTNDSLRERSRDRMLATRMQYDAVARSAKRASASFGEVNGSLRDIGLFLGHDFNSTAIALIQTDAVAVRDRAQELGAELDRCLAASEEYVASAAPLGVAIQPPPASPTDETSATPESTSMKQSSAHTTPRR
jgi:hypothetical protein